MIQKQKNCAINEKNTDNVSKPELWVFPAFRPNGTVIIACPGGGYYYLEIEKEGTGLAPWFNYIGVTLAVLKYRMPNGHFETTLSDVQEAVKIMRQHTEDWASNSSTFVSSSLIESASFES